MTKMLTIRTKQMEAFHSSAMLSFEGEMHTHLAKFSPLLYEEVKEEHIRKAIRLGITRSESYGFTFRGPVRLYLEMMFLFGSSFDTDPQYPWAAEVLNNREAGPQMQRAEQLYEQACHYRKEVNGEDDAYWMDALKRLVIFLSKPLSISGNGFIGFIQQEMASTYPQKTIYLGSNAIRVFINKATSAAEKYGIATERGNVLAVILAFTCGHGCFEDVLYPWINEAIHSEHITDAHIRVERLENKAITWINRVLDSFDKEVNNGLS